MALKNQTNRIPLIVASPLIVIASLIGLVLYSAVWVVIISLLVASIAAIPVGVAAIASLFITAMPENLSIFVIGCGIASLGVGLLMSFIMIKVVKLYIRFSKAMLLRIKRWFVLKGERVS